MSDENVTPATNEAPEFTRADSLGVYLSDSEWTRACEGLSQHRLSGQVFTPEDFAAFGQSFDVEYWDEEDDSRFGDEFEKIYSTVTAREIVIAHLLSRIDADAKVIDGLRDDLDLYRKRDERSKTELAELRAVVGPKMPCGCYAVELRFSYDTFGTGILKCRHNPSGTTAPISTEYVAWRQERRERT